MKLVVDTNIVFSALLNPSSNIGELLLDINSKFEFFASNYLLLELNKYNEKLSAYTKLTKVDLEIVKEYTLAGITFIAPESISKKSFSLSKELTKNIDLYDQPIVALAIELDTKLWTGDKKLYMGIKKKDRKIPINTEEILKLL